MRAGRGKRASLTLLAALCAAGLLVLLAAGPAFAIRYASTTGNSKQPCTEAKPCDIATAIHGVIGNEPLAKEEVVVEPGTYTITGERIEEGAYGMNVHGASGAARPVIKSSVEDMIFMGKGGTLAYLDLESEGSGEATLVDNGVVERMLMRGTPTTGGALCQCYNGTVRDSVIIAKAGSHGGAAGVVSNGGKAKEALRNDTLVSESKEASAIVAVQQDSVVEEKGIKNEGNVQITALNTIALNTAGGPSVEAANSGPKEQTVAKVAVENSYYATVKKVELGIFEDLGGHITATPLFVNLAAGDFREATGSPTIDAGLDEPENGTVDFEGAARTQGAHTDVGAFEATPPPAPPAPKPPVVRKQFTPPLVIVGLAEARRSWWLPPAHGRRAKGPVGTSFSFAINRAGTATLSLARATKGRRGAHGCEAPSRRNKKGRACTRYVPAGTLTAAAAAGADKVAFKGLVGHRRLSAGSYRVTLNAVDAKGLLAAGGSLSFKILG